MVDARLLSTSRENCSAQAWSRDLHWPMKSEHKWLRGGFRYQWCAFPLSAVKMVPIEAASPSWIPEWWQHGVEPQGTDLWWTCSMGGSFYYHMPLKFVTQHKPASWLLHTWLICEWSWVDLVVKKKLVTQSSSSFWLPESCTLFLPGARQREITRPAVAGSRFIPTGITVFLTNSSLRQLSVISTVARASGPSYTLIKHNLAEQVKTRTNEAPLWGERGGGHCWHQLKRISTKLKPCSLEKSRLLTSVPP